jgi:hypothetical protein
MLYFLHFRTKGSGRNSAMAWVTSDQPGSGFLFLLQEKGSARNGLRIEHSLESSRTGFLSREEYPPLCDRREIFISPVLNNERCSAREVPLREQVDRGQT